MSNADSPTVSIFELSIQKKNLQTMITSCHDLKNGYVCFVNAHSSSESVQNPELKKSLMEATYLLPDGMPLVWLSKLKKNPISERVSGPDFMREFLTQFKESPQAFVGGQPSTLEILASRFPNGIFLPTPMRPFSRQNALEDWANLKKLSDNDPRFVWVGLGAPKQELWMNAVAPLAPETVFFGVGAAFDFLAGTTQRAPQWMRRSGLEWLYRLTREPKRLVRRYWESNSAFLRYSLKEIRGHKSTPKKSGP